MAGLKEIKRRIKSVQNTKKITYAMKLVSAAKLRKAQDWLTRAREYTEAIEDLLEEIARERELASTAHPLMRPHEAVRRIRLVVIGGRRGLCGAYNSNINRKVEAWLAERPAGVEVESVILGKKPADYYRRKKYPILRGYEDLSDNANEWPLDELYHELEASFMNGRVDEAWIVSTRFRSALSMHVEVEQLLPLDLDAGAGIAAPKGVTIYKPSPEAIFDTLVPKYLRAKLLLACLESKASEQGSRMTAMDAATENAGELMGALSLKHNKLRQAAITADILDIIGGSENIQK